MRCPNCDHEELEALSSSVECDKCGYSDQH